LFQIHHSPWTDASRVQCIRKLLTARRWWQSWRTPKMKYIRTRHNASNYFVHIYWTKYGLYSHNGVAATKLDWHAMGAQPIVSRDRRRPTTTTILITNISCLINCPLYSWQIGWHNIVEDLDLIMDARKQITYLYFLSNKWLSFIGCYQYVNTFKRCMLNGEY